MKLTVLVGSGGAEAARRKVVLDMVWAVLCFNEVDQHYNPNDFDSRLAPQAKYSAQDLAENPNIGLYREGLGSS